ncbi:MAG: helix-turn-helix domain-containing protein [Firmicutes bacterium]|nr:helix-turn-helix domain-containing protein [Bacillota bacterium]
MEKRYKELRRAMEWSRETAAAELGMSDDKLERIENGKQIPNPQDVLRMADAYRSPELCNYYCHHDCEIGQRYVPEVPDASLPKIILNLLRAANEFEDMEKKLIRITADEEIEIAEIPEMVEIQNTLEKLSLMIEALQLCIEKKIGKGEIDREAYEKELAKYGGVR